MYQEPKNKVLPNHFMASIKSTAQQFKDNRIEIPVLHTSPQKEITPSVFQIVESKSGYYGFVYSI